MEYAKSTTPIACPLKPEVALHWLAVNGSQPLIAENPSVVSAEAEQQPLSLPRELQVRMTTVFFYEMLFLCLLLSLRCQLFSLLLLLRVVAFFLSYIIYVSLCCSIYMRALLASSCQPPPLDPPWACLPCSKCCARIRGSRSSRRTSAAVSTSRSA